MAKEQKYGLCGLYLMSDLLIRQLLYVGLYHIFLKEKMYYVVNILIKKMSISDYVIFSNWNNISRRHSQNVRVCCYFGVCPQLIVHGVSWKILMRTGCIYQWYRGRKNWEPLSTEDPLCWESVALSPPVNVWKALWLRKCSFILPPIPLTSGRANGAPLVRSADHRYIWYLLMISVLKSLYFRLWKM